MGPAPEGARALRIGVFGGTFDPPHVGHLAVARDVADALALDQLLWIPARIPPHKQDRVLTPAPVRLAMVRAAAAADPRFRVSDRELVREGPSYTVDTLRELKALHPGAELFLLLGADQLLIFRDGWKDPEQVLELSTLALMDREGESAVDAAPDLPGMERAVHVPVRRVDVSATRVRQVVQAGGDASALVPPGVWEVVVREGLYRR